MTNSIAPKEIIGVCVISGLWGVGKTLFAMTCEHPELTAIIDFDQKSKERARALGIEYHSPAEIGLADPLDYNLDKALDWFTGTIRSLTNGKTTLIIDTGSPVEDAFGALVRKDPMRYGVKPKNAATDSFGGVNPGIGKLWETTVAYLSNLGYERIFIIMHMSQQWTNQGPIPNRYKVKGNKTLNQLSNLSLILMRSKDPSPTAPPDAIVMKEALGIIRFDGSKFKPIRPLPPRIPGCDWGKIRFYLGDAESKGGYERDEIPTPFELECYGEFMSPEQLAYVRAVAANPRFSLTEEDAVEGIESIIPQELAGVQSYNDFYPLAVKKLAFRDETAVKRAIEAVCHGDKSLLNTYSFADLWTLLIEYQQAQATRPSG